MDKKLIASLICLVFAVIILFFPVIAGWEGIFQDDQAVAEFPVHYSAASNLQDGFMPSWNPYTWAGASPFNFELHNAGGGYYPLWLFYFFADLSDLDSAYWLITIFPLFILFIFSSIGMFFLIKKVINCNYFSSVIGALVYIYSPVFLYYYGSTNSLIMLCFLPWLLYLYSRLVDKWRFWQFFLAGVFFASIILAGRPHFLFYIMIIWGSFAVLKLSQKRESAKKNIWLKPILIFFSIFIIGSLLSATYWVPLLDTLFYSEFYRDLSAEAVLSGYGANLPISYLATLFIPSLFGSITGRNFIFKPLVFSEANLAGGLIVTFLVILGAILPFFINHFKSYRKFATLGVFLYFFSILSALGENTFFYRFFIGWLPVVGGGSYPIRFRFIQCFAASLLVALGINYLTNLKFIVKKSQLKKITFLYLFIASYAVGLVLFLPLNWQRGDLWIGRYDNYGVEGFFEEKRPIGLYTPRINRVRRIRVKFDGESRGQIRYADSHKFMPDKGNLLKKYDIKEEGWVDFLVDLPPNKFLWIYPQSGPGRIAYWNQRRCLSFSYNKGYIIHPNFNVISIHSTLSDCVDSKLLGERRQFRSLFYEFRKGKIVRFPIVGSIIYWFIFSSLILVGVYWFSSKKIGYFLTVLVLGELLFFGLTTFYKNTFIETQPSLEHLRYLRPSSHPMVKQFTEQLPDIAVDPTLRVTSDYPLYDNFVYLNKENAKFSLLGTPVNPLEKRFRKAIESAYSRPINRCIHYQSFAPTHINFLNNFSVGYFISRKPTQVFPNQKIVPLEGEIESFVHINKDVLPRVYTLDRVVAARDEKQLEKLVSGDLRRAVYMTFEDKEKLDLIYKEENKNYIDQFNKLQRVNQIKQMNFINPSQIIIEAEITIPSMLVLTEVWYPGWRVFLNGKEVDIKRVNYCQRGIWVGKGNHLIELKFKSSSASVGGGISLVSLVLMLGLLKVSGAKLKRS